MLVKISEILKNKKIKKVEKKKPVNERYCEALVLEENFKIDVPILLRLMKKYTFKEISSIYAWWADYPLKYDKNIGLLVWKLKELYPGR